jgi:DNA-binding XRE family transcriptional regulator
MDSSEFSKTRRYLGKTQNELARLLCISPKAVQSYEQGWRRVPTGIERQALLLASLKATADRVVQPCWEIKDCPPDWRENCIVWEYKVKLFCWFVNGTYCQGRVQAGWEEKITICQQCEIFQSLVPTNR